MTPPRTAILHYAAPPVVGGVEAVIQAHAQTFINAGYPVTVVAGRGQAEALPDGAGFVLVPEVDSQNPLIASLSKELERGQVPRGLDDATRDLVKALRPVLSGFDNVIVHNVFTKHFNLPLTVALCRLLDGGALCGCIAWCHDFTWTSPNSRAKVHPGFPWDLLRTHRPNVTYVAVSERRRQELAGLYGCPAGEIRVVYNGVDPRELLGLSEQGHDLVVRLGLLQAGLVLLMPVRVTQAKNIEYALQVVAALKALGCRPKLVLTGPPDPHDAQSSAYYHELRNLRRGLDVEDAMHFVYELDSEADQGLIIAPQIVGDLFRASDLMFMPSHREGFAMPVLEAGLVGMPVVCSPVPAAEEIGGQDVIQFDTRDDPAAVANRILAWAEGSPVHRLRRRVRQRYTWEAIFERDIKPLLEA